MSGFEYWAGCAKLSEIRQEFIDQGFSIAVWREDGRLNKESSKEEVENGKLL